MWLKSGVSYFQLFKSLTQTRIFRSAGTYTLFHGLNSAIPFLLLPVLTRYLSPEDYGVVAMFQVLVGIVGNFTGLSVHGAIGRQYFEKETIDLPKYIFNCLFLLLISTGIVFGVVELGGQWICKISQFPRSWLWTVVLVSCTQCLILIILSLWQIQFKSLRFGLFQISMTLGNLALSLILIVGLGMGWEGRIGAQVVITVLFGAYAVSRLRSEGFVRCELSREYIFHALTFGIPLIPHALGSWAILMTDRVLLTHYSGIAMTGIYVVGAQIGMVIGLLQDSFNRAWVPWFYEELKKNEEWRRERLVKITYVYFFTIVIGAICFAIAIPRAMSVLLGKSFAGAENFIIWLALGHAFDGMYKMVANYIFYVEKTYLIAGITFVTACANFSVSWLLIQMNGPVGAAQGTMCAFFLTFILSWITSAYIYQMPWGLHRVRERSRK